jgi:hypothetical protein
MGRIHQVARRMFLGTRSRISRRMVLVTVARRSLGRGTKVQSSEDPVAQKDRTHEKECELPTFRAAEETQEPVLPPTIRHCTHILSGIPP